MTDATLIDRAPTETLTGRLVMVDAEGNKTVFGFDADDMRLETTHDRDYDWWAAPGYVQSQRTDYKIILNAHHLTMVQK